MVACKQYGGALEYVPKVLRTSDVCMAACQQWGGALAYVPPAGETHPNLEAKIEAVKLNNFLGR